MWTHDVRQALRLFRREPAFAAAAVLTLALGIGANTALFAVVEAVLLRPLPFEQADRARRAQAPRRANRSHEARHRHGRLHRPARAPAFPRVARGFGGFQSTFFSDGEPLRVEGAVATPDALRALRVQPVLGRLLEDDDAQEGAAPVAIVSHEFWRTQLGSDPQALTRSIQLGTTRRMVVGVLPPGLPFPGHAEDRRHRGAGAAGGGAGAAQVGVALRHRTSSSR